MKGALFMNTDTLETFILLSELKNYTQTANQLFIAQSTVTNRIQELEAEIGKTLFIRSKKQLKLTREGEYFLNYARRITDLKSNAMEELKNMSYYETAIRIGSTNTIYDCHLANKLVPYSVEHPNTKLNIVISHTNNLIQMLHDNTIDVAFTYISYSKNKIKSALYTTDNLLLVTSSNNQLYRNGISQKELSDIPYLYCDFPFQELGSYIKDLFPAGHVFPLEIDRSANLLPFLLSGKGYSFLPESLVQESLRNGLLIHIPLLDFTIPCIHSYVLTSETKSNPAILEFMKEIM
jgi:LysR family transcriptional repressor of citA